MDLVELSAMYGVCFDEDQSNDLSTINIEGMVKYLIYLIEMFNNQFNDFFKLN